VGAAIRVAGGAVIGTVSSTAGGRARDTYIASKGL